jgi:hypothetical protein
MPPIIIISIVNLKGQLAQLDKTMNIYSITEQAGFGFLSIRYQ